MISLIICSTNAAMLQQLYHNVARTIGVPFEWLPFPNGEAGKGICEVYNLQAQKARYEHLVFVHEDVLFETDHWGAAAMEMFRSYDVWGIAGSNYKSRALSGWATGQPEHDMYNITHFTDNQRVPLQCLPQPRLDSYPAVALDGVLIAATRACWQKVQFNAAVLHGFHGYDVDFSLRCVLAGFKAGITTQINLLHFTDDGGNFGDAWMQATIRSQSKLAAQLPLAAPNTSSVAEASIIRYWLDFLKNQKISLRNRLYWIWRQKLYLYPLLAYSIVKFLLYRPLRLHTLHHALKRKASGGQNKQP